MSRYPAPDLIKTISIFGVVFIHVSSVLECIPEIGLNIQWAFRFCVPSFLIVWAYFFEKSYQKRDSIEQKKYILGRFKQSLVVFFSWSFFYFFQTEGWELLSWKKIVTSYFLGYGWSGQYFFIIMFQLILLFPLTRLLYDKKKVRYAIVTLVIIVYSIWEFNYSNLPSVLKKVGDIPFVFWIPYVFCGISLARNTMVKIPLMSTVCAFFMIPLEFSLLEYKELVHSNYVTLGILFTSIIFCCITIQREFTVKNEVVAKAISYIGGNTMTIFVANPIVIKLLRIYIVDSICDGWYLTEIGKVSILFLFTSILLLFCLLIAEAIKRCKLNGIIN